MSETKKRPLVVFSDDWGRHPSSTQHIVSIMLGERDVLWVNTIGTRMPSLKLRDVKKVCGKLYRWVVGNDEGGGGEVVESLHVIDPMMWPSCRGGFQRKLNATMISRVVNQAIRKYFDEKPIVLTTIPITADLIGRIDAAKWVYHIVDDFASWPGLDAGPLQVMHEKQLGLVDEVAVVSDFLGEQCEGLGRSDVKLITHGVDHEHWENVSYKVDSHPVLDYLRHMNSPRAVFWGLIDERLDWELLREFSAHWPGEIALIGPHVAEIEKELPIKALRMPGEIEYALLPQVAQLSEMLLMPYRHAPVTAAMQPLKLMEYLSTGKPVVCTDIPATLAFDQCCDVVGRDDFVQCALNRMHEGLCENQRQTRRQVMRQQTWRAKAEALCQLMGEVSGNENVISRRAA